MTRAEYLESINLRVGIMPDEQKEATEEFKDIMMWLKWWCDVKAGRRDKPGMDGGENG